MDQQDTQDVNDQSVFALISALCGALSGNVEFADSDAAQRQVRALRRTAFSHLLNRSSNFDQNQNLSENISLGLFTLIAAKKAANDEWTHEEYVRCFQLLEKFDNLLSNSPELIEGSNIGRMLIALGYHRPPRASTSTTPSPTYPMRSLDGLACIPSRLQLTTSQFFSNESTDNEIFTPVDFFWKNFKSLLETLQLPQHKINVTRTSQERLAIDECHAIPRSSSRTDEGFSSPSDLRVEFTQPFDWSNVETELPVLALEWESFPHRPERQYFPSPRSRAVRDTTFCPIRMVKVPYKELIECIKALLIGVPSHLFQEVDGEFFMTPGLFTDRTPPHLVYLYSKKFIKGGMLFLRLLLISEYFNSLTSASMSVVIQNFIMDYQELIRSIPEMTSLLQLTTTVSPFIDMLAYLVNLIDNDQQGGWHLLETLHEDALRMVEPNFQELTSALFADCFTTYLKFIEEWIFEGKWHQELFFQKNLDIKDISDRTSWSQSYSFDPSNAPSFIPAAAIYECGKLCHLVKDKKSQPESWSVVADCRPQMRLIKNKDDLAFVKQTCRYYSHTGDALRLEALEQFREDHQLDLSSVAREKAKADNLLFNVSKAAEREKSLIKKLENLILMKAELEQFERNRNAEELKRNLFDLLEDDRRSYHEIEQIISSGRHQYELIERYLKNEERIVRCSLVSNWREKRHCLDVSRATNFGKCFDITEYGTPVRKEKTDTVDYIKSESAYDTSQLISALLSSTSKLPLIAGDPMDKCSTASMTRPFSEPGFKEIVERAPKDFLVLTAMEDEPSSSSEESLSDDDQPDRSNLRRMPSEALEEMGHRRRWVSKAGTSQEYEEIDESTYSSLVSPRPGISSGSTAVSEMRSVIPMTGGAIPRREGDMPGMEGDVPRMEQDVPMVEGAGVEGDNPGMEGDVPRTGGAIYRTGGAIPRTGGAIPRSGGAIPRTTGAIPRTSGAIPQTTDIPRMGGAIPSTSGDIPSTSGDIPRMGGDIPRSRGYNLRTEGEIPRMEGAISGSSESIPRTRGTTPRMRGAFPWSVRSEPRTSRSEEHVDEFIGEYVEETSSSEESILRRNEHHGTLRPFYSRRTSDIGRDSPSRSSTSSEDSNIPRGFRKVSKSLRYFMNNLSVQFPLEAQSSTVRRLVNHKLFVENCLLDHLRRLRNVLLKSNGVGAQALMSKMCRNVTVYDPAAFCMHLTLLNMLEDAYPKDSKYFTFRADPIPQAFDTTESEIFSFLNLDYACSWPLNLILTDTAIQKYNAIWKFLNTIDVTLYYLQEVFNFLRVRREDLRGDHYTQIQLHRHLMLTFVNALKFYSSSIVAESWVEFHIDLQTEAIQSPDELYGLHAAFIKGLYTKMMLNSNAKRIYDPIEKALHYVLVYCLTVLFGSWESPFTGQSKQVKFNKLLRTFENFKGTVNWILTFLNLVASEQGLDYLLILRQLIS
ncbi:hypothetical protein GE061_000153 [Apolygus lucorum]|uniref:Uncharacterized protein n=1 Tax=Apolygus lucorum TaxID=248454 RepID=A0A6A4KME0_APOLU|nr:hypothetical protein GE061_000153 [Apolygus lucorum]